MRHVDRALTTPSRCAVLPQIGIEHPLGYIDTGSELGHGDQWDQHVYVSIVALREMCKLMGWPLPEEADEMRTRLEQLEAVLDDTIAERDALKAKFGAIDMLASEGFRARNKPGRPPKKKNEVAV
jgi:hypothetical protein